MSLIVTVDYYKYSGDLLIDLSIFAWRQTILIGCLKASDFILIHEESIEGISRVISLIAMNKKQFQNQITSACESNIKIVERDKMHNRIKKNIFDTTFYNCSYKNLYLSYLTVFIITYCYVNQTCLYNISASVVCNC
jgi:hypothetical protein